MVERVVPQLQRLRSLLSKADNAMVGQNVLLCPDCGMSPQTPTDFFGGDVILLVSFLVPFRGRGLD